MKIFLTALLFLTCATGVYSQKTAKKPAVSKSAAAATPTDNYWTAQRNVETAITQLEAFLKNASSDDKRIKTATKQLQMLKEIRMAPGKNAWSILMNEYPYLPAVEWRVASIDSLAEKTSLNIEIRNTHPDREQCFQTFDQNPLVLIDNKGQSVPMLKVGALPEGIKLERYNTQTRLCLKGNQTIFLNVDFAPLSRGTTSAQLNYSQDTGRGAKPVAFSLFKQNLQ